MARVLITKPQRLKIARLMAASVARVFNVDAPPVAHGGPDRLIQDDCESDRVIVPTSAGFVGVTVECCPRGLSMFARFEEDMDDAKREVARIVGGNTHSGKLNWHCFPDSKPSDKWINDAIAYLELHLIKIRGQSHRPKRNGTQATLALQQRRIAVGAERIANREASKDERWTDYNVRMWGGVMANAMKRRNAILLAYLEERKAR